MKRILIVTDKLYPDEIGGSCTYAYETAIELQKYSDLDIFTCYPEKNYNDKLFLGSVYRKFNKKNPVESGKYLLKYINSNGYDTIIFHSVYAWFIYYCIKLFVKKKPKQIAIYHGPWHKEAKSKYLSKEQTKKSIFIVKVMKILEWLYVNDSDNNFIFLSDYMRKELLNINKKLAKKECRIIPGGVNSKNYIRRYSKEDAKKALGISSEKFVIFILRRLEYRMGINNAIEAINNLEHDKRKNTILLIGGTGSYKNKLEEIAKSSGVDCIFTGFIPDEKINLYFCAADLFLVPSIDLEGFGLVNLESLSMGVPVLATPQGGMIELSSKLNNMYTTIGFTPKDIADGIEKLFNVVHNEVVYEDLGNYSWNKISQEILKLFIK